LDNVEIKEVASMTIATIPVVGSNNISAAYGTLVNWAERLGLMNALSKMVTIYFDSFRDTPAEQVRIRAGMTYNENVALDGPLENYNLVPGKCIIGHFKIGLTEFEQSWKGLFAYMKEKGYQKSDQPPFEIYQNNFNEHPEKLAIVDFYIPVR
jgi:AraC family transcriptional regulator